MSKTQAAIRAVNHQLVINTIRCNMKRLKVGEQIPAGQVAELAFHRSELERMTRWQEIVSMQKEPQ